MFFAPVFIVKALKIGIIDSSGPLKVEIMEEIIKNLAEAARQREVANRKYFKRVKKKPPKNLDRVMQQLHDLEFSRTDCLSCANCCKTTGPLFTEADIVRISRSLKLRPQQFIDQYLTIDEDGDHVLQMLPCPFLGEENYCSIYEVRPKACREFPHTDRRKFYQITDITLKNLAICPAAFNIVEAMKRKIPL